MDLASFLGSTASPLGRVAWHVEQGLDGKWNVRGVMEFELVRYFGIGHLLIEPLILVLSHLSLLFVPNGLQRIDLLPVQPN